VDKIKNFLNVVEMVIIGFNLMIFPQIKKYQDIDTGKFVRDKLSKIISYSLGDIIEDTPNSYYRWQNGYLQYEKDIEQSNIYNFPKHVPKDNDFDKEIKIALPNKQKNDVVNKNVYKTVSYHNYEKQLLLIQKKKEEIEEKLRKLQQQEECQKMYRLYEKQRKRRKIFENVMNNTWIIK